MTTKLEQSPVHGMAYYMDNYLGTAYQIASGDAKEIREYLLSNLKTKGINPKDYNRGNEGKTDPPIEIYEYQPFFLLKRIDGTYSLLDGFRRLLWYNTPSHNISIRVYEEEKMSPVQIMKLLVYLNHFKFYGGNGAYYDRGFSLAMKTIFGLNIPMYYQLFNSYLTKEETKRLYSREHVADDIELDRVKERLIHPMFISDMKFAEGLVGSGVMMNDIMGALIQKIRISYPDKELDVKSFLKKVDENQIILTLQEKYKKTIHDETGARGMEIINQLTPLYENILIENFGGSVEKTYAEIKEEVKKIVEDLKKDKNLTKFTGNQKCHIIDIIILKRLNEKKPINFKCVIHPFEPSPYSSDRDDNKVKLPSGLLNETITIRETEKNWAGSTKLTYGFTTKDGNKFLFSDNWGGGGYRASGKKLTKVRCTSGLGSNEYDVDVFIDITKKEIEDADKLRKNPNR